MNVEQRFLNSSLKDIFTYILDMEKQSEKKDKKIEELINENAKLEVRLDITNNK